MVGCLRMLTTTLGLTLLLVLAACAQEPVVSPPAVAVVQASERPVVRVTRVTPDGDEVVEVVCPAVVTISNELGQPRYPTAARTIAARRMQATAVPVEELALPPDALQARVTLIRQFVPTIQGNCEFISGETPAELATRLIERLREDRIVQ